MTEYDPDVIQYHADRLYARAAVIVLVYLVLGALIGGLIGFIGTLSPFRYFGPEGPVIGAVVGGVIGFGWGQEKSFHLRLTAQLALCQMQIEYNTRRDDE